MAWHTTFLENSIMSNIPEKAQFAIINKFGGPEVFEINERTLPEIKPNQILIKVTATSINPIDWKQRKGNHKLILGSPFPITLGYDVSGIVVKTGEQITLFKTGDKVVGVLDNKYGGAYGQFAVGTENCFTHLPLELDETDAAAFPMVTLTALQALRDVVNLQPRQTIIVNGASGGVGHIALQIAQLMNANVIAVASSKSESFVRSFEPNEFIDYTKQSILNTNQQVDVFFDVVGNYSFPKTKHLLKNGGIYLNLNYIDSLLKSPLNKLHQIFTKGKKAKTLLMKHVPEDLELIKTWMLEGKLNVHIDQIFELNQIIAAHQYAEKGHSKGKNIIKMPA